MCLRRCLGGYEEVPGDTESKQEIYDDIRDFE
jgi:hypothetical protein